MQIPRRQFTFLAALTAVSVLFVPAQGAEFCKWTDDEGVVHYAEKCPDDVKSSVVATEDTRTESQLEAAEATTQSLLSGQSPTGDSTGRKARYRSLPLSSLGPPPPNAKSEFLETKQAMYSIFNKTMQGRLVLDLEARETVPEGAWVEAEFPNASDISRIDRIGKETGPGRFVRLESPPSRALKCWNYPVRVSLYSDASKEELLGVHEQVIQSQVNMSLVQDGQDMLSGVTTGLCTRSDQADFDNMSVEELEALCEKERDKHLAPQRKRMVEYCVEVQNKPREYCERYYQDYGDATRTSRFTMRRAQYMNLPECIAAQKARENK